MCRSFSWENHGFSTSMLVYHSCDSIPRWGGVRRGQSSRGPSYLGSGRPQVLAMFVAKRLEEPLDVGWFWGINSAKKRHRVKHRVTFIWQESEEQLEADGVDPQSIAEVGQGASSRGLVVKVGSEIGYPQFSNGLSSFSPFRLPFFWGYTQPSGSSFFGCWICRGNTTLYHCDKFMISDIL